MADYPLGAVRADPDDVTAWLARRRLAATAAAESDWVAVRGLGPDGPEVLAELSGELGVVVVVLTVENGALEAEVMAPEGAVPTAADADGAVDGDAGVLAAACGRSDAAGEVAAVLSEPGLSPVERHQRLAETVGLPGPPTKRAGAPVDPVAQDRRTAASGSPGSSAGGGQPARKVPTWLTGIVVAAGVLLVVMGVAVVVATPSARGFMLAAVCAVSAVGCFLMAAYVRKSA